MNDLRKSKLQLIEELNILKRELQLVKNNSEKPISPYRVTSPFNTFLPSHEGSYIFENIFETEPVGIIILDQDLKICRANKAFCSLLGYSEEGLKKLSFEDISNKDDFPGEEMNLHKFLNNDLINFEVGKSFFGKNKSLIRAKVKFTKFPGEDRSKIFIIGRILDLTSISQADDKPDKGIGTNHLNSGLIDMLSHEYKNPLTTVSIYTDLLKAGRDKLDNEKYGTFISKIEESVKYMTDLINNILAVGKTESEFFSITLRNISFHDLCNEIVNECSLRLKEGQKINFKYGLKESFIKSDERFLRYILSNLLTNAIKYSPPASSIYLGVSASASAICLSVKDEGIGIPKNDMDKIYDSFYRGDNIGNAPGTGLGLTIVKKSVEHLRGQIICNSRKDKGTKFKVILPK